MLSKIIIVWWKEMLLIQAECPAENTFVRQMSSTYNTIDFVWKTYTEEYKFDN